MHLNNIYTELYEITSSENIRITLTLSVIDHLLYIKKELDTKNEAVYQMLKKKKIKGIPEIYHIYHYENKLVIIEQYFNMTTLENYRCNHILTKKEIRRIMVELCKIVKRLHSLSKPIIHRDLKLDNIFYDGHHIIVFDFDISCFQGEIFSQEQMSGSYGYVSPESYYDSRADQKSDIYSLGIIYYQLLYHTFPLEHTIQRIDDLIIHKMICKDPKKRVDHISRILFWLSLLVHFPFLK